MRFQAYVLDDENLFVKVGEPFDARTSLDAVQQAREYWPGLSPIVEDVKYAAETIEQE